MPIPRYKVSVLTAPALVLCALAVLPGCNGDARSQIQTEIAQVQSQRDSAQQLLLNRQSELQAMHQRLHMQHAELDEYNARIQGYMLDHKLAVAAIAIGAGGADVALSTGNVYSEDVKQLGVVAAVIAAAWALYHMDEVTDAVKNLNYAAAHVRSLQSGMNQSAAAIQQEGAIQQSQSALGELDERGSLLRTRLSQL